MNALLPPTGTDYGMLFVRRGWRIIGIRRSWWPNLKAFLWWGPRNPKTGKLLPPGVWAY